MARFLSQRRSTIGDFALKKTVYFAKPFLAPLVIINVIVGSTKTPAIRELFVISAVLKLPALPSAVSAWGILN
jgi:hypothetical protein